MLKKTNLGLLLGATIYVLWGFLSLFWKLLSDIPAYTVFSYRMLFTFLTMLLYMLLAKRGPLYKELFVNLKQSKSSLFWFILAAFFISANWVVYIYAIGSNQATAASLGYYINPLTSILLSVLILKETISRTGWLAILLAVVGVVVLVMNTGELPLVTLILAVTFSFYGLIKKKMHLPSDFSMFGETLVILPLVLVYLMFFSPENFGDFTLQEQVLLALSGVITAVPLLLFAEAVKLATFNLISFIQYISPTIQLLIAIFLFHESISSREWPGFMLIWIAIIVFILGQIPIKRLKIRR